MIVGFFGLNGRISRLTWWTTQLFVTAAAITFNLAFAKLTFGRPLSDIKTRAAFSEVLAAMSLARDVTTSRMEGGYGTYAAPTAALATSPGHGRPVFGKL
jgi:hypothetical protein